MNCSLAGLRLINNKCSEICGDGIKYMAECDDGNRESKDGCSSDCKIERGYECRR